MCTHTLTHYRKVFRSLSLSTAFGRNQTQRQTSRTDRVAPARCKLCHAQENDNRKTIESSSKLKVQASFEFLRIWFSKFVLNLGRGWRQFNAHMLRFMCFVGFAWPECKTKRHFILCNISFFFASAWSGTRNGRRGDVVSLSQPQRNTPAALIRQFTFHKVGIYVCIV